ncbi:hypothetical protein LSTR_LSTR004028 [Laodelphax striatellus]|uniref:Uncharacterized protein n=1 Tax=Laodelphax striatellus TaxID=195883 RepID=A0A482WF52_LAOST|nr:hypothetical protein LSTR_LSTR004028 [Laodelphax striatellus]
MSETPWEHELSPHSSFRPRPLFGLRHHFSTSSLHYRPDELIENVGTLRQDDSRDENHNDGDVVLLPNYGEATLDASSL